MVSQFLSRRSPKYIQRLFIHVSCPIFFSGILPDTRKAILKVRSASKNLPTYHFSGFSPYGGKILVFKSCKKIIHNAYPIRNFILNNFALRDRFHFSNVLRDMRVYSCRICGNTIVQIVNLAPPYLSNQHEY